MLCEKCQRLNRITARFCDSCGTALTGGGAPTKALDVKGPLDGIRVLDWTMWQFGPVATMMLADLGAEVIKVESFDGDHARQFHQVRGDSTKLPGGLNSYFESLNRQKKSIALDLKNPKGIEVLQALVAKSDVFVQNFRKGVAERLGLGFDDLKKHNPLIVYGSATGFGPEGPDADKPAFALTGEARSGSLWWAGPDDDLPYNLGSIADQMAGVMLSYGVLGGIIARDRFGVGQQVDVSHLGSMMWLGGNRYGMELLTGASRGRSGRTEMRNPLWNSYRCKDGKWLVLSMNQGDRYWPLFCDMIQRPDIEHDPRFSSMNLRATNRHEVIAALDEVFATRTRDEWEQLLRSDGRMIWERVQDLEDLTVDPQVVANRYIVDFEHPVLGMQKFMQTPVGYGATPLSMRKAAPALGEDTEMLLIDVLGYDWDRIGELQSAGAIL